MIIETLPPLQVSSVLSFQPRHKRRILCVFPRYSHSFGTFNHSYPLVGVAGLMPPQGILLIVELIPGNWDVRFIDENIDPIQPEDFAWAEAVFVSGMHIQRERIRDITRRAHLANKVVALGGPSVSSAPEYYPEVDLIHCGEAGDGTLRLLQRLDESIERPAEQIAFHTVERLPMSEFPSPAYNRIDLQKYLFGSAQFSSGCPFTCEFCDIPGLYGRNPRLKTSKQIVHELDQLVDGGCKAVYFVDDNFIGNPRATQGLLSHLIEWQKKRDYSVRLACEATLNLVTHPKILEQMREAGFIYIYFGIETPEPAALKAMKKGQNLRTPILEAIQTVNRHGMEAGSGIIMGLDTDTEETPQAIMDFADVSNIPLMTVNILYALPKTPLFERLKKENRVLHDAGNRDSNIVFLEPYENVLRKWRRVIGHVYSPEKLYARYDYNALHTYPNRIQPKYPLKQVTWRNLKRAVSIFFRLIWHIGIWSDYRHLFWAMAWKELRRGKAENFFTIAFMAHHLIIYSRECAQGKMPCSNYSVRQVEANRTNESLRAS